MRRTPPATTVLRAVTTLAVIALAAAAAGGCGPAEKKPTAGNGGANSGSTAGGAAGPSGSREPTVIVRQIEAALASQPGVVKVKVNYSDYATAPGSAGASITVRAGADQQPVTDEAIRLIWLSRLDPLKTISIGVIDEADTQKGTVKDLNLLTPDASELVHRYGPRPK